MQGNTGNTGNIMPSTQLQFENFLNLMQKNWASAHQGLFMLFPRIERIATNIDSHIKNIMESRGLLASDFHLITAIRRSKSTPPFELMPSELCNYMLFSWGGLTKVMKRLEEKGVITRVDCEHDKRVRLIRLTETGLNLVEQSVIEMQEMHKTLLHGFTNEEIALLDKLLAKLNNNIDADKIPTK